MSRSSKGGQVAQYNCRGQSLCYPYEFNKKSGSKLALLALWLMGTATIAQGAHYQFQANSVRHKRILSVLFVGLQMVQDNRIILTRAAMKAAWSALRELTEAHPWTD